MKDFDQNRALRKARDRTFRIGGETFTMKASVRPEVLVEYEGMQKSDSNKDALRVLDEAICAFIEEEDGPDRYRAVRSRDDDPVDIVDIQDLVKWLVEEHTSRPTSRPSASSDGPRTTGTSLTASSLSEEATPNPSLSAVS